MAFQRVNFPASTSWTPPPNAYLVNVFLVGGGGGGNSGSANNGGGGAGGAIKIQDGFQVTPGSAVTVTVGAGGTPGSNGEISRFSTLTVAGGGAGASSRGGDTFLDYNGTVVNQLGGQGIADVGGGGGASPSLPGQETNSLPGNGAVGYFYNGILWAPGGGGGCGTFSETTTRPIPVGIGAATGGGNGGGESQTGFNGGNNTGAGGGGGASAGTSVSRGVFGNNNDSPTATYLAAAATAGGSGGSGYVSITYDTAEAVLTTSQPGVAEGDSIIVFLKTKNIWNGAVIPFTISGTGIAANDFNPAVLTGSFTVSSTDGGLTGSASTTITIATDAGITESQETVIISLNNSLASTTFKIGDRYQFPVTTTTDAPGYLSIGNEYTIITAGNTDFTLLGAANNIPGTTFIATGTGLTNAGEFVIGKSYIINDTGNTDFTKLGASNNSTGTLFTATGTGIIPASSIVNGSKYTIASLGNTDFTEFGAGWRSDGYLVRGTRYTIKFVGTSNFTLIGAPSNDVGVEFVATSIGDPTKTGAVIEATYVPETGQSFQATVAGSGSTTGTVYPAIALTINHQLGKAIQGSGTVTGIWVSKSIQISDYNNIQSKVAAVLGSGSGSTGYGQVVLSNPVTTSNKLAVSNWNLLRYDIINAYQHQTGTLPSFLSTFSVGNLVKYNTTTSPFRELDVLADVITTQKFDLGSGQYYTQTAPLGAGNWFTETTWPKPGEAKWTATVTSIASVFWPSAASARYFFNSGGEIRFTASRAGGSVTGSLANQNNSWTAMLAGVGTVPFGGNKPVQDAGALNAGNYYRLTDVSQQFFSNVASSPYSTNEFRISARSVGIANNSSGTAANLEFRADWIDNHTNSTGDEGVDGTLRWTISVLVPNGTLQPSGAGNFTVIAPTITFSQAPG